MPPGPAACVASFFDRRRPFRARVLTKGGIRTIAQGKSAELPPRRSQVQILLLFRVLPCREVRSPGGGRRDPPAANRRSRRPVAAARKGVLKRADTGLAQTPGLAAAAAAAVKGRVGEASSRAPRQRRGGRRPAPRDLFVHRHCSLFNAVHALSERRCTLWVLLRRFKIREHERGLLFKDREFKAVLRPGRHYVWDPLWKARVDVVSVRDPWFVHEDVDVIAKAGALRGEARVVDLKDHERAVVWVDGRLEAVLKPGLYVLWTVFHDVRVEVVDARAVRFEHAGLEVIAQARGAAPLLETVTIETGHAGLFFKEGCHEATLPPGVHARWKGVAKARILDVDLREQVVDVAGQEIMTADKVTLRLNAVVTFKVADPVKAVTVVEDYRQALYREAQLALRAVVGTRELDVLLSDKDGVARELDGVGGGRVAAFGVEVVGLGIRDVILPGEMKDLMNKVTEAKKAAEAALITRREETAAMRSQANTAKILESNPTLMRLRELEVLEKVSEKANLTVVLGEKGLADRVVKLL